MRESYFIIQNKWVELTVADDSVGGSWRS